MVSVHRYFIISLTLRLQSKDNIGWLLFATAICVCFDGNGLILTGTARLIKDQFAFVLCFNMVSVLHESILFVSMWRTCRRVRTSRFSNVTSLKP